jgi:hypothetical protein
MDIQADTHTFKNTKTQGNRHTHTYCYTYTDIQTSIHRQVHRHTDRQKLDPDTHKYTWTISEPGTICTTDPKHKMCLWARQRLYLCLKQYAPLTLSTKYIYELAKTVPLSQEYQLHLWDQEWSAPYTFAQNILLHKLHLRDWKWSTPRAMTQNVPQTLGTKYTSEPGHKMVPPICQLDANV